jgi:3-oxoacyl-[acyl-carrier protein] reductase
MNDSSMSDFSLTGKVALVTGAGSGFGRGIATALARAGARVGILDVNLAGAAETQQGIGDNGLALQADVTDADAFEAAVTQLTDWAGAPDILVNNAGIGLRPTPLEAVDPADFQRVFDVNMRAIFIASQVLVPAMKQRQRGCILNIASTAGVSPRPGLTWYNASKGWVITATRSMAVELAPSNIRVNALNPVAGDTPLLETFMGEDTPEVREKFLATIPLGRFSTPRDLGNAAVFLCSDAAAMITGVAMEVDGGRCV